MFGRRVDRLCVGLMFGGGGRGAGKAGGTRQGEFLFHFFICSCFLCFVSCDFGRESRVISVERSTPCRQTRACAVDTKEGIRG